MPTACALVYAQLTGATPDPAALSGMQVLLDDVARALSSVVLVYAQSADAPVPVAIPPKDLIDGTFSDGAHQFTTRSGKQFHRLTVQRSDMMAAITVFAQWRPDAMVAAFTHEAEVIEVGATFLRLISINFIAQGFIFTCSSMFQGLGNTRPALWSSATRLITFAIPAIWVSTLPGFKIEHVWYLSIATVTLQAIVSVWLLRVEFTQRLLSSGPAMQPS